MEEKELKDKEEFKEKEIQQEAESCKLPEECCDKNYADESTPTPPSIEQEWAGKLGMDFDPAKAETVRPDSFRGDAQPESRASGRSQTPPPMYVMPAGTPLPPNEPTPPMPPTFMVWAILSTICCCLPAGVVAIIYSAQVSSKYFSRDYEGARRVSERTEIWIIVSIVLGIIANALYMPLSLMFPNA